MLQIGQIYEYGKCCNAFEKFKCWSFDIYDRKCRVTDRYGSEIAASGSVYCWPPGMN